MKYRVVRCIDKTTGEYSANLLIPVDDKKAKSLMEPATPDQIARYRSLKENPVCKCEMCGRDPINHKAKLHRQNPKGQTPAIWRCERCNQLPVAPEVTAIFDAMDGVKKQ